MLVMRLLLGISLCLKHCSRALSLADFPVSESGAVFPDELQPVTGLFLTLAVFTLASVESGKWLLSLPGMLSGHVSEQGNGALLDVAAIIPSGCQPFPPES